jgi:hypothetical protein
MLGVPIREGDDLDPSRALRCRGSWAWLCAMLVCAAAPASCGANSKNVGSAEVPQKGAADGGSAATSTPDASAGEPQPFAGSTAEATSLISTAVDKKQAEINACVRDFRIRRQMARDRVAISFGIDQEGKVLGVTSKGREDGELKTCVHEALKGAPFPRSHAGVITVTKTYEELVQ